MYKERVFKGNLARLSFARVILSLYYLARSGQVKIPLLILYLLASNIMASSSPTQVSFQILDVFHGPPDKPLYYRIKAGSSVRYLAASKPLSGLPDTNGQYLGFNTVPIGD